MNTRPRREDFPLQSDEQWADIAREWTRLRNLGIDADPSVQYPHQTIHAESWNDMVYRMALIEKRLSRRTPREGPGAVARLWARWRNLSDVQILSYIVVMLTIIVALLSWEVIPNAGAAGNYVHTTSDPAYHDGTTLVQDPYSVGEGAGAANEGNHVVYWGPIGPDRWQDLAAAGWPYDRTRALLSARYPAGVPGHFHFDHDAAALLLPRGLTVAALDRLYAMGDGYGGLPTTKG